MPDGDNVNIYTDPLKNEVPSNLLPCRVLERFYEDEEYFYTIEIQFSEDNVVVAQGYPNDAEGIQLYDIGYSPMWHMKEAFRHKLYVPDDVFPKNWMTNQA